jgi:hypothetical protein
MWTVQQCEYVGHGMHHFLCTCLVSLFESLVYIKAMRRIQNTFTERDSLKAIHFIGLN